MSGQVAEADYLAVLEELIRGTTLATPNKATKGFALMYQNELRKEGCLDETRTLNMDLLGDAYLRGRLDIKLLSNVLGRSDLADEFKNMNT